ncbi:amino acid permease [Opisthorchis viverrini]|uniref:Amino acid permease n=1 Tax=Opisthorchis viverrini TaxID=6198 RepID=A0A1S8X4R6_OPIVI|nr:amino acid permease [Opisthorchis viverrini]
MKFRIISLPEFFRRIIRRKPLRSATTLKTPLNRCLSLAHLTAFCVSSIIGIGLYDLAGQLVRKYTGPSTVFNYLIVSITVVSTSLCLAELTTLMPRAGSLYIYTYVTFGECAAFCTGWIMVSVMIINTSATAKAFSDAVNRLTNGTIRHWSNANLPSLGNSEIVDSTPDLLAMVFLILLALATLSGAYISMTASLVFSGLTVIILIALSVSCFVLGDVNNFHGEDSFLPYGFKGLLEGSLLSIFTVSGFEYVANASEEAKDPRRDIPIALVLSVLTCTMANLLISFGIAYVLPHWKIIDREQKNESWVSTQLRLKEAFALQFRLNAIICKTSITVHATEFLLKGSTRVFDLILKFTCGFSEFFNTNSKAPIPRWNQVNLSYTVLNVVSVLTDLFGEFWMTLYMKNHYQASTFSHFYCLRTILGGTN